MFCVGVYLWYVYACVRVYACVIHHHTPAHVSNTIQVGYMYAPEPPALCHPIGHVQGVEGEGQGEIEKR